MTQKNKLTSIVGGLVLLLIPLQSVGYGQLGKRLSKKSDCATSSVASSEAGCCQSESAGCCQSECAGCCQAAGGGCCNSVGMVFEIGGGSGFGYPYMVLEPNAIYLTVNVPEITLDCILAVNGDPTARAGASRRFIVRNLEPGKEYEFKVAAITKNRGGVELMQKETVKLNVGDVHMMTMKPVRRKADIEREEAEQAAKDAAEGSGNAETEDYDDFEPEDIDASEPVAMAFPFSLD